jgi:hypothetical protein
MTTDPIIRYSNLIVLLTIVIIGLLAFVLYDKYKTPANDDAKAFCGTVDSTRILMDNKNNYRYAANFIDAEFNPEEGRKLFTEKCAMCHSLQRDLKIIGPTLFNLFDYIPSKPKNWIFLYLKNTDALIKSGDKYAKEVRTKYAIVNWNHTDSLLTDQSLKDLVGFIGMNK